MARIIPGQETPEQLSRILALVDEKWDLINQVAAVTFIEFMDNEPGNVWTKDQWAFRDREQIADYIISWLKDCHERPR